VCVERVKERDVVVVVHGTLTVLKGQGEVRGRSLESKNGQSSRELPV